MTRIADHPPDSFGSVRKRYRLGTHRMVAPEATLERIRPLMERAGITRIANITGLDRVEIPVVAVYRPNSRSLAVTQGKGLTIAAARVSGLMEALEMYHAEHVERPLIKGTWREMREGHRLIDLSRLPLVTTDRLDPDLPLMWTEGFDLLGREPVWLPYETVHLDFREPPPEGSGYFVSSSNGLASGNHWIEAVSHGLCEVVERDALSLWDLNDPRVQARMRLDVEGIEDEDIRSLLKRFGDAGVDVAVWDITSDVGIPCYFSTVMDGKRYAWRRLFSASGSGCYPSRKIALLRALTEAAQSRLTGISGARDDLPRPVYSQHRASAFLCRQRNAIDGHAPGRSFDQAPTWEADTLEDDLAWELERLREVGIEQAVAVDLTRAEFGIPVVRMVIPGLESAAVAPGNYQPGPRGRAFGGVRE